MSSLEISCSLAFRLLHVLINFLDDLGDDFLCTWPASWGGFAAFESGLQFSLVFLHFLAFVIARRLKEYMSLGVLLATQACNMLHQTFTTISFGCTWEANGACVWGADLVGFRCEGCRVCQFIMFSLGNSSSVFSLFLGILFLCFHMFLFLVGVQLQSLSIFGFLSGPWITVILGKERDGFGIVAFVFHFSFLFLSLLFFMVCHVRDVHCIKLFILF